MTVKPAPVRAPMDDASELHGAPADTLVFLAIPDAGTPAAAEELLRELQSHVAHATHSYMFVHRQYPGK